MDEKIGHEKEMVTRWRYRWGSIGLLVMLVACGCLGVITVRQWRSLYQSDRFLDVSLLAMATADYSRSQPGTRVAPVGLDIIGDMLVDSQVEPTDLSRRLASVTAVLLSPVPTATPVPVSSSPQATAVTGIPSPHPTATPPASNTATPHSLPTATRPLPVSTATLFPTSAPS